MDIAKKSGCLLSYDPNLRLPLWPSAEAARDGIMSIWNQSDITKISEEEITFLTGGDDPYDDDVVLKKLSHPNLKLLLVTEGAQGCRYYTKEFKGRVGGVKVEAVDTTGAGDAFIGGILNIMASYPNLYKVQLNNSFAFEWLFFVSFFPSLSHTNYLALQILVCFAIIIVAIMKTVVLIHKR